MYIELANKLKNLGHNDMAQLIDNEYNTLKTPTDLVLRDLGINPNTITKSIMSSLFHIRVFHGKELERRQYYWQNLEELDKNFPLTLTLLPRVPGVDATREDNITPRISLAKTIKGAAGSLSLGKKASTYLAIYKTTHDIDVITPFSISSKKRPNNNLLYVHDAEQWGEVWSLRPVAVERLRLVSPDEKIY